MIDFIDVEKTYASGVEALRGINLTIEDGEFVFVIGKSGSGKSTLLKCITCEERPTSGKVTIDNFDISHMSRALVPYLRRKIGMIYQDFRLIETKTVAENVAFAGEIIGVPKQSLMNTVQICLSVVGLKDKADCYPQELSGGEQQRVAIARAMVNNPSLIVADEPTGNLDPETSEAIMAMLLEINRNGGTTVIICTHDSTMVDRMKQRVIEIEEGLILRDEKDSSYKGEAEPDAIAAQAQRTSLYSGAASSSVSFGDDEAYNDDYDDAEYADTKASLPSPDGVLFGETTAREYEPVEESFKPEFDLDKDVTPITSIPDEVFNGDNEPKVTEITEVFEISEEKEEPEEADDAEEAEEKPVSEEPAAPAEEVKEAVKEEPAVKAEEPERAEVIEINIPEDTTSFSFGDEDKKAPAAPVRAAASAPSKKNIDLDPDIDPDEDLSYSQEEPDNSRLIRREFKRREKEEKAALKEAKRKEKLDKKKKVRRTDFKPGTDIDMMPEDDE